MDGLIIEQTKSTPKVVLDPQNAKLSIEGQSYPENAFKFYEPIFSWLDKYLDQLQQDVVLEIYFHMPYINTSSSKCMMMLFEKLEEAHEAGKKVTIRWYYDQENEIALECAEEFKEDLGLPFEIIPLNDEGMSNGK
ncbi:hypothetical protein SOV_31300 [Sporomusa ovata DSM 2662]|uniref:FIG057251: Fe-S oxidoreductase n=1 Tax=Sporomusa ovata TaxID=2378 RepID=A0A0U1L3C6_9FIRM|nr:SiaC family regulatory phosphoprotein [Sporomusa ovata]EQB25084.1 hypothetical protein SOV_5c02340 [Sporomusa ovata DSM 2662]CQR73633.1 FIG057251: Fe-S oxidoreductase [Sporomusa ovata]